MANVKITMPEDLMIKLSRLGKEQDRIAAEVLKAGAEIVEDKLRSNLIPWSARTQRRNPELPVSSSRLSAHLLFSSARTATAT